MKINKGLLNFTILNILDKGFIFLIPLIVLMVFKDKVLYNQIEYIYAIANILIIFLDFGIKNYIFYKYKESDNKASVLKYNRVYVSSLFYFYSTIAILFYFINLCCFDFNEFYIYFFIFTRSLYSLLIAFYSYYFRLINNPSQIYIYSFLVSLFTIFLIGSIYYFHMTIELMYMFLFQIVFILYFLHKSRKNIRIVEFNKFYLYAKEAIKYAYPLMINLVMITIINQFGKIYAYNFLSIEDMTILSFIQRLSLIIVLFHGSLSGYYAKNLFTSKDINTDKRIFMLYFTIISIVSVFIYLGIYTYVSLGYIQIDLILAFIMILATFIWCMSAYIELYFNRDNINKYIPIVTFFGFVTYVMVLYFNKINLDVLIYSILISNVISLLFALIFLKNKVSF